MAQLIWVIPGSDRGQMILIHHAPAQNSALPAPHHSWSLNPLHKVWLEPRTDAPQSRTKTLPQSLSGARNGAQDATHRPIQN